MRFEESLNGRVATFPELRTYGSRETVPYVSHEDIAKGIARGRRLHARFCRQATYVVLGKPVLACARAVKRFVRSSMAKLEKHRAFRSTVRELSALEDRQLNDIGIVRSDILRVAWSLVYADRPETPAAIKPTSTENPFEHARAA